MDEDLKRAIEDLPVVSSVRFHAGDKTHKAGSRTVQLVKTHAYDTCSESPCKRDAMRKQVGA
jgi:hypothetical protein